MPEPTPANEVARIRTLHASPAAQFWPDGLKADIGTLLGEIDWLNAELATRCSCYPNPADHETDCPQHAPTEEPSA